MSFSSAGQIRKMRGLTEPGKPVQYYMRFLDKDDFLLNAFLGKKISLVYNHLINCVQCGREISKSFQQGYCFPCLRQINECGNCMLFPERCLIEKKGCPTDHWAHQQCGAPHVVYLSNTSAIKVGITREMNPETRWIDQGATQALPVFTTQNRYQAGLLEVAIKHVVADKTNWRKMLQQNAEDVDMHQITTTLLEQSAEYCQPVLNQYQEAIRLCDAPEVKSFNYPVLEYPEKVRSLSFDKLDVIEGVLLGIKGQYLILEQGVLNIRKFSGYEIQFMG